MLENALVWHNGGRCLGRGRRKKVCFIHGDWRPRTLQTRVLSRRCRHIGGTGIGHVTGLSWRITAGSASTGRLTRSAAKSRRKHSAA